jgi:hypothetical protein
MMEKLKEKRDRFELDMCVMAEREGGDRCDLPKITAAGRASLSKGESSCQSDEEERGERFHDDGSGTGWISTSWRVFRE